MTYSLVVRDGHQWGVAVQSKFLAVGSFVPSAGPEVGAIATQAYANPHYGPQGLALLREGLSAAEVVARLVGVDDRRDERQVGVVDADGGRAARTGPPASTGRVTAPATVTRRRGTSSSVRDGGRARRDVRGVLWGARGAPARLPRRRAGSRR